MKTATALDPTLIEPLRRLVDRRQSVMDKLQRVYELHGAKTPELAEAERVEHEKTEALTQAQSQRHEALMMEAMDHSTAAKKALAKAEDVLMALEANVTTAQEIVEDRRDQVEYLVQRAHGLERDLKELTEHGVAELAEIYGGQVDVILREQVEPLLGCILAIGQLFTGIDVPRRLSDGGVDMHGIKVLYWRFLTSVGGGQGGEVNTALNGPTQDVIAQVGHQPG